MQGEGGYVWEEAYKRSWDILADDAAIEALAHIIRRPKKRLEAGVQRGIIRYVCLMVDLSIHAMSTDWRPTAAETALRMTKSFIGQFFDQNPLSMLSLCIIRDGIATPLTSFSSNPTYHLSALETRDNRVPSGEPSLQNALELAMNSLSLVPSHGTKQVVILYSALTTCDPGDILETGKELAKHKIQVNVVGLAAQLQVCKTLASQTGGQYTVAMNETHLEQIIADLVEPPPLQTNKPLSNFILMDSPRIWCFQALCCVCGTCFLFSVLCAFTQQTTVTRAQSPKASNVQDAKRLCAVYQWIVLCVACLLSLVPFWLVLIITCFL